MGLADEPALAIVVVPEGKLGDRGAAVAELMVNSDAGHVVAGKTAPAVRALFRHDEERNPLDAGGRPVDLGQEQVDDVFGRFVVGAGDEDLLSLDLYEPSAWGKAVVLRSVSDEPACGSVRAIVPCQFPANIFGT